MTSSSLDIPEVPCSDFPGWFFNPELGSVSPRRALYCGPDLLLLHHHPPGCVKPVAMVTLQSKWRFLFMFLGIQLVVMALLSREGYHKRVSYFIRIFRKSEAAGPQARNRTALLGGGDVYANLSHLSRGHGRGDEMPYCPKTSPLIGECCPVLAGRSDPNR